jgi:RNA polymerase sigma-70 factor, ECF subfamily
MLQCIVTAVVTLRGNSGVTYIRGKDAKHVAVDVEQFYRKYGPMVLRRCRTLLRDEDAALDATQDVFVQVLRRQESLHDTAPSSLLYRIATNVCLNIIRKNKRAPANVDDEIISRIAGSDKVEDRVVTGHFLDQVFESQKEGTREIAVYHYVDGMTLEETADLSGLSVSGVRKRLRTLKKFGTAMQEV